MWILAKEFPDEAEVTAFTSPLIPLLTKRTADLESHFKAVLDLLAADPTKYPVALLLETG